MSLAVAINGRFEKLAEFADHALDIAFFYLGLARVKFIKVDHLYHELFQELRQEFGVRRVCRNALGQ